MAKRVALIIGTTGATAKRLVDVLGVDPAWSVLGISRRPPATPSGDLEHLAADLMDMKSLRGLAGRVKGVTHAFYCARAPFKEGGVEDTEGNVALLRNALDLLEESAPGLAHVHLLEGGKWYGMHLGPFPTPAREDAARHMPPNFYYEQEDLLRARQSSGRQAGKRWSWSASRPSFVYDFAPERPRNLVSLLGVWAAMCRELGLPLDFPGKPGAHDAYIDLSDATNLARGQVWMSTAPAAANGAFNLTDGEPTRWSRIFAAVARHFGMPTGAVRTVRLATWMADKEPLWQAIIRKHGLKSTRMADLALWDFGDFMWHLDHDIFQSMMKIRQAGWTGNVDCEAQVIAHLVRYQEARLIPR